MMTMTTHRAEQQMEFATPIMYKIQMKKISSIIIPKSYQHAESHLSDSVMDSSFNLFFFQNQEIYI